MIDAQICTTACVHKVMILISLQYIRQYGSVNLDGVTRQFLFSRYRRSDAKSFFSTLAGPISGGDLAADYRVNTE